MSLPTPSMIKDGKIEIVDALLMMNFWMGQQACHLRFNL
jgi:hypothetical protein